MMKLIHGDCRDYIDDVVKGEGNLKPTTLDKVNN